MEPSSAISSSRGLALTFTMLMLGVLVFASCSSSDPVPTATPTAQPSTPVPTSTIAPTSTPTPTATAVSFIPDLTLNDLSCVDFHSGVPVPNGPDRWYQISGSLFNSGELALPLRGIIEIRNAAGTTLISHSDLFPLVEPGQTVAFDERVDLSIQADNFSCRVTFARPGDDSVEFVTISAIEPVFAP